MAKIRSLEYVEVEANVVTHLRSPPVRITTTCFAENAWRDT
jgi:hypothetical protein